MRTLRTRTLALALLLLVVGPLRADDHAPSVPFRFGRIEGRPDRDEILAGARPFASGRPADGVAARPYERRPEVAATARPRRSTADYYPNMRPGQYTNHTPRFAHCTPSRGYFIGDR